MPFVALLLGIIAAAVRVYELKTVFDPFTGLAKPMQPVTIALILLSAVAVIAFIILSRGEKKLKREDGYNSAMMNDNKILFVISMLSALGLACGSVLYYFEYKTVFSVVLGFFGFLAVLGVIVLSRPSSKSSESEGNAVFSTLFVIFVCLWMVLEYKARSADPVLLDYVYDFLALCSAAMAFYYKAGFAFSRPKPRQTVMFMLISLYFCIVAAPGAAGPAQTAFYISLALLLLRDLIVLGGNLTKD